MMFEVADLSVASPATVSRCGMIYMEPSTLGWRPLVKSWMTKLQRDMCLTESHLSILNDMFERFVDACLQQVHRAGVKVCPLYIFEKLEHVLKRT